MIKNIKQKIKDKLSQFGGSILNEKVNKECPEQNASLFSRLTFGWVDKLIMIAYLKETLDMNDVFDVPDKLKSKNTIGFLNSYNPSTSNTKYSLIFHIYKEFILKNNKKLIFAQLLVTAFSTLSPLALKLFIEYIQKPSEEKTLHIGFIYCCLLFISSFTFMISQKFYYWYGMETSIAVKSSIISRIFEKSLLLSNSSKRRFKSGSIINLMSVDVSQFSSFFWTTCIELLFHPIQVIVLLVFLYQVIGWSSLIGFTVMVISIPINTYFCNKSSSYYDESLKYSDKRVNLISELVSGIRNIKMLNWESIFINKIEKKRNQELNSLSQKVAFRIFESLITHATSTFVLVSTFAAFSLFGNVMTLEIAFTSMNILHNLKNPIEMIPIDIYMVMSLLPSCKRIDKFLKATEIVKRSCTNSNGDVSIINGTFKWEEEDDQVYSSDEEDDENEEEELVGKEVESNEKFMLNNINFKAPSGKLTIICSPIGTGKTCLVSSLIGEIYKVNGQVNIPDGISYTSQEAFLLGASIRDNILFGLEMDIKRYKKVIEACCLVDDLLQMSKTSYDLTECSEKGVTCSGGQKQRISLARALYANSDCYIMDEPLSAVDPQVAHHLFNHCIQGMMAGKTRILVTHQIQFIPSADHIVYIDNGHIIQGTYNELKEKGIDFESIMKTKKIVNHSTVDIKEEGTRGEEEEEKVVIDEDDSFKPIDKVVCDKPSLEYIEQSKLVVDEEISKGEVSFDVYKSYFKYGSSNPFIVLTLLVFLFSQVIVQLSDFWIVYWTEGMEGKTQNYYISIYVLIAALIIGSIMLRELMMSKISITCAKNIHSKLLNSVSSASIQFFDTNPSGRILNRFGNDISDIDNSMVNVFSNILVFGYAFLVGIISIIYINPVMVIPFLFLLGLYWLISMVYSPSAREINRLESVSESPISSLLQETYNGLITIRCFKQQSKFIDMMQNNLNENLRCIYVSYAIHEWISIRLEILSSVLVFIVSLFSLVNNGSGNAFSILALTTSISLTSYLGMAVKEIVDLETSMNSFERIEDYIQTPNEGIKYNRSDDDLIGWPSNGAVEFKNVEIRYRPNSNPSLSNLSMNIESNENIGIVGRTGAGKSTIGMSLFRLVECTKGSILIDGIDISTIGLNKLRSSIGIVPQDPLIFNGTVRFNLDPFNNYSDKTIWKSLKKVQLYQTVYEMPLKLNSKITNSSSLSYGQKQLLCICRCLLMNPKIVLLDESTSGIDYETAESIKQTINENFGNSTLLIIAHRLDTIIDSSKIAVIHQSELVEFDTPSNLISNNNSLFKNLIKFQTDTHQKL